MNNEFTKITQDNITRYILESDSGTTTAGSVATVPGALGKVRKRGDNILAQEADKKTVPASTPRNFVAKNAKTGGAGAHKDKKKAEKQGDVKHRKPFAEQGVAEGSLNEFAPGGEDGNSPYAYGMAILGYAEDYKQIHGKSSSTNDDVADILEIGNIFLNKGMAPGIAALFSVDTFVSDSIVADLAEQGFNVMADLIDKRPRSAQWHQQMAAGQQALADYEANRKKSSEETDSSKAVDTLARVLKSSLQDYQAAAGDKNKLKQLGLLIGLSDNHRSAIHHALQQIQQNDFDGAIKSLVATPPGASGPGYDALDYGYSKQKAGISVQQLIQSIRKHFELSEQGVAEGFNGEYDDEAGMAQSNLITTARAVMGLLKTIKDRDNLPEWGQEKIAKAEMMLVSVWDYLQSQKAMGNDPQQDMAEGERTMSRAAKGYEKYGKKGMQALAKAGRDDASDEKLNTIRNKHNKYDEGEDPYFESLRARVGELAKK